MTATRLNMAVLDSTTEWIQVPPGDPLAAATLGFAGHAGATKLAVDIVIGSAFSWGTDTAKVQYSLMGDQEDSRGNSLESANDFSPARTLSTSATALTDIPVAGKGWVRLKMSAAAGTGDPQARAIFLFR